jgi:branched-chain amino acid transport system substrate-binding protein
MQVRINRPLKINVMKKILSTILILLFVVIALTNCKNQDNKNDKEKEIIKIGALLPLSGNLSFLGKPVQESLEMFVKKYNSNPNNDTSIKVYYGDTKGAAKEAVSIAQKMITKDKIHILVPFLTNVCQAINPIAEKYNIFTMALSTYPPIVDNKVTVKLFYDFKTESTLIVNYLKSTINDKCAIFVSNDAASKYQFDEFMTPLLEQNNINYNDIEFHVGQKDFSNLIPNKVETYDSFVILGFGNDFVGILDKLNAYKVNSKEKTIICGIGGLEIPRETHYKLVENIVFTAPSYFSNMNSNFNEFRTNYKKKYKHEPTFMAVYAYDNMLAISKLIEIKDVNQFNKGNVIKENFISLEDLDGLTGNISIKNDGQTSSGISMYQYVNEKFEFKKIK